MRSIESFPEATVDGGCAASRRRRRSYIDSRIRRKKPEKVTYKIFRKPAVK
jgi:hypothetical protein